MERLQYRSRVLQGSGRVFPPPLPPAAHTHLVALSCLASMQEPTANGMDTKLEEERDPETYDDAGAQPIDCRHDGRVPPPAAPATDTLHAGLPC